MWSTKIWSHHLLLERGQHAADHEAAEVARAGADDVFERRQTDRDTCNHPVDLSASPWFLPELPMRDPLPTTIYLKNYAPPPFLIPTIDLDFDMHEEFARVHAKLAIRRNPACKDQHAPLALDGDELELESVAIDGRALATGEYALDAEHLTITNVADAFTLETVVRIEPRTNTKLMGLYASKDGFFTQCEAEGFRRITFFIDRPDVMARYTTTIHAEREKYPVLLSNGNPVVRGEDGPSRKGLQNVSEAGDLARENPPAAPADSPLGGERHWVRWEDPFPKPSYLFAMVAAKLDKLEETFVTRSGRKVTLQVWVEPGKLDQCSFAMQALKKAMKWDEEVFGLEVDLDCYMIVAVGDFNMGAMENKGLNVFNTKYVLARPDIATDSDFLNIDRVVAHEYFHNWTGNRVTCRDWFQLSLKEGLTVFRDREFGADTYSRPVTRIQEVRALRARQFPEDAGPMAHPVRPQSYMEISNFYTATVYEKGAEVVRMIHTLIGKEAFRRGMDLYFKRHDGQAVTCDDFVQAMADASGVDLTQFKRWYDQAGTPTLDVRSDYDDAAQRYVLTVKQSISPTPGQPEKLPMHIPLAIGLVSPDGKDVPLQLQGETKSDGTDRVLSVKQPEERFVFVNVTSKPVPSLARRFSAPAIVKFDYSEAQLTQLMAHDSDPFNRWEAGQRLATGILLRGIAAKRGGKSFEAPHAFVDAFARVLRDGPQDPAFSAEALSLPSETYLAEQMDVVDPDAIHAARTELRRQLARTLRAELAGMYDSLTVSGPYSPDAQSAGKRALRNLCLAYLMELESDEARALALKQFDKADNMTDRMAALVALANSTAPERESLLQRFYTEWKHEPLVVDKWLAVQATSRLPDTLERVKRLTAHEAFDIKNPNKVYALIRSFCANHVRFHASDGGGYAFAAEKIIELNALNPQIAARIARAFDRWKRFDTARQALARAALERVRDAAGLSKDVAEVVTKALA
jgi:aminopeptidase N